MNTLPFSRRQFITTSAVLSTGLLALPTMAAAKTKSIRLGGPSYAKTDDPEELALAHRKLGYRAAYCPKVTLADTDRIKALSAAFAKHDVVLAEVGRWKNMMDAVPETRKANLETVTEGLALAEALGALCCVDIAGSFNPTSWFGPHPDNFTPRFFDAAVENARKVIDAVKPKRAKFCYEMMGWAYPDTPDNYLKLIKAIDRPGFGVHLDVCNAINSPEKFYRSGDLINECFDKLGKYVVSCHAKDLVWDVELNVHFREVGPGKGEVDYATYLNRLAALPHQPPLMIEHLKTAEEYTEARNHIFSKGKELGIEF
jgi:sugar phosphate isomerase/epimerase